MMIPTDAQIEAGAIALFAANNANGDAAYVQQRWPNYSDMIKAPYLRWSRAVLVAAMSHCRNPESFTSNKENQRGN